MEKVDQQMTNPLEAERTPVSRRFVVAQFVLRVLVVVFATVAIALMATSATTISVFGLEFSSHYYDSSALKFLMAADVIVGALALLSLVTVYFMYQKNSNPNHLYYLFLHDLILMLLMISALGAASATGYIALVGQEQTMWYRICDRVGKFCVRNGVSLAFSYAAFLCLFVLTIMSSYKLRKS